MTNCRDEAFWPPEIGFIPFIGDDYEQGFNGVKVLLLGESHYAVEGQFEPSGTSKRLYTRGEFDDCQTSLERRGWPPFWRRLDQILTGDFDPDPLDAADAWRHIVYANYVQDFARNGKRPNVKQWREAMRAFPLIADCLQPDAILVIGHENWNHSPNNGRYLTTIQCSERSRDVWTLPHESGEALMTWVYHPRSNLDPPLVGAAIYQKLLALAAAHKADVT